jgi:hypothetical protein
MLVGVLSAVATTQLFVHWLYGVIVRSQEFENGFLRGDVEFPSWAGLSTRSIRLCEHCLNVTAIATEAHRRALCRPIRRLSRPTSDCTAPTSVINLASELL